MRSVGTQLSTAVRLRRRLRTGAGRAGWSPAQRGAWRASRLAELRRHAVGRSPFYRRHHGTDLTVPLSDLPPLTKEALVERFDDVVTDRRVRLRDVEAFVESHPGGARFLGRYEVASTSGSTGRPALFLFDDAEWVSFIAGFARSGALTGPLGPPEHGRLRFAKIGNPSPWHTQLRVGASIRDPRKPWLRLSATLPVPELAAALDRWRPHSLSGAASLLRLLAVEQIEGRLRIAPRRVVSSAEVLSAPTRALLREAWDVEPFDHYVATETGLLAAECGAHAGLHVLEDDLVLEVVDDDGRPVPHGEPGTRAFVTVLASRTIPLIRYELADSLRLVTEPCPCGRPGPRIVGIEGRRRDLLRLAGGDGDVTVHPAVFTSVMDATRLRGWQVVHDGERLTVRVCGPRPGFDAAAVRLDLLRALADSGATMTPVEIEEVPDIPRGPGGKVRLVVDASAGDAPAQPSA